MAKGGKISKKKELGKRIAIPFWEIQKIEKVRGKLTASKRVIVIRTRSALKYKFVMAKYCKIAYVALNYLKLYPVLYVHVQQLTEEEKQRLDEMNLNLARIVTEVKEMSGGELVVPNIKELEECVTLVEGIVENNKLLRSKVHEQSLILDRITANLQYVTQNLKQISTLVGCMDSKAAAMYAMLQRKKENEHIKKVEREIGHAIGKEMVIPAIIIFKMGLGLGPLCDLRKCYLYMVEDYFAIVYRVAEVDDFHPRSRFYHGKRYVLVKDYHFQYSDISRICLTVIPQFLEIHCHNKSKPIRIFSGFIQHIVNELALRTKVGSFPVYCQPGAKKFQYGDVEIKKIPIPQPGRSGEVPAEIVVKPYIPPPSAPDLTPEEVKRDIAKHVQEQGIDHIQEMVTILTQDQQLLKEELARQVGQIESAHERTDSNLLQLQKQSQRVDNKL
uniref:Uncharacterized protein n=1 Tax=Vannella robusta TaxID=1487602 RepID=A0A7S4HST2_9EUKA|mmetsp:Transcript_15275/g.19384  ORF Transcript_15275/g.19384 Transcript_15275/m.19384 type:complete len:444 (+) Transcript_15275:106-1437(+)